jgi:hypothetical protein
MFMNKIANIVLKLFKENLFYQTRRIAKEMFVIAEIESIKEFTRIRMEGFLEMKRRGCKIRSIRTIFILIKGYCFLLLEILFFVK